MNHEQKPLSISNLILSKAAVATWLGVSQCTIDRWAREGRFPPKLQLGPARVGWQRNEIEDWLSQKKAARMVRSKP